MPRRKIALDQRPARYPGLQPSGFEPVGVKSVFPARIAGNRAEKVATPLVLDDTNLLWIFAVDKWCAGLIRSHDPKIRSAVIDAADFVPGTLCR